MEDRDLYVTPLDIIGMQQALQECCPVSDGGLGVTQEPVLPGAIASLESFERCLWVPTASAMMTAMTRRAATTGLRDPAKVETVPMVILRKRRMSWVSG